MDDKEKEKIISAKVIDVIHDAIEANDDMTFDNIFEGALNGFIWCLAAESRGQADFVTSMDLCIEKFRVVIEWSKENGNDAAAFAAGTFNKGHEKEEV